MKNDVDRNTNEIAALWSVVMTLRQIQTQISKAKFLLDTFGRRPHLVKYFRAAMDPAIVYGIRSGDTTPDKMSDQVAIAMEDRYAYTSTFLLLKALREQKLKGKHARRAIYRHLLFLPEELRPVVCCIIDKDLVCGLKIATLNKVFKRMGKEEIVFEVEPETHQNPLRHIGELCIDFSSQGGGDGACPFTATAVMYLGDDRVANMVFVTRSEMRIAVNLLRNAGVRIEVPNYVKL